jgi:hypothetical protein
LHYSCILPDALEELSLSISTAVLSIAMGFFLSAIIVWLFDVFVFTEWAATWRTNGCAFGEFETAGKAFCRFDHE